MRSALSITMLTIHSDLAEFQPFVNLPSRSITDYYQLIKRPLCLKMVIKRARGQHGREAATGVTDYKTWDAFEDDVSLIWKNAQEYNEDGSEMYELAEKFKVSALLRQYSSELTLDIGIVSSPARGSEAESRRAARNAHQTQCPPEAETASGIEAHYERPGFISWYIG